MSTFRWLDFSGGLRAFVLAGLLVFGYFATKSPWAIIFAIVFVVFGVFRMRKFHEQAPLKPDVEAKTANDLDQKINDVYRNS
jgi:hypothetical protein